jgi:hypothetical protein
MALGGGFGKAGHFGRRPDGFHRPCHVGLGIGFETSRRGGEAVSGLAFAGTLSEYSAMTCTVKVANGVIQLPPGVELPDGAEVRLTISDTLAQPSFAERYAAFIGVADDLPADLAANLDHYVHGLGKK